MPYDPHDWQTDERLADELDETVHAVRAWGRHTKMGNDVKYAVEMRYEDDESRRTEYRLADDEEVDDTVTKPAEQGWRLECRQETIDVVYDDGQSREDVATFWPDKSSVSREDLVESAMAVKDALEARHEEGSLQM